MGRRESPTSHPEEQDWLDAVQTVPAVGSVASRLERSIGPSCLLSLVIVLLLVVVLRRFLTVPWPAFFCLAAGIWFAVLTLLVRSRPIRIADRDDAPPR